MVCQQVGQKGQAQWDLAGNGHLTPKPRHVGPPRSNQNDSLSWEVARVSGTGDTNKGNWLLNLVANGSIFGRCHLLHIVWKTSGRRDHSVWMVWLNLDSLSATTLSWPGMYRAFSHLFPGTPGQDSP